MKKLIAALSIVATLAGGWFSRAPITSAIITGVTINGLAVLLETNPALASNCSAFTYTLTNGTTADANQVMSNFNTLLNCANNNLAHNGANSDITSLSGLTTPLSVPQGGTGLGTLTANAFVVGNGTGATTSLAVFYPQPQGRLTLISGKPVMNADATAQITVYYDTFIGNSVPVNGAILAIAGNEVSMGLDAVTPHIASGNLYDVFGISNSGSFAICAGPAWTNTTTRSTGIGFLNGLWTNSGSLTHCWGGASGTTDFGSVSTNAGTYLGTLYATANGQTGMAFRPPAAAGGTNNILGLYNAYNQVVYGARSADSNVSWTYNSATLRPADNSTSNRISYVDGLGQAIVENHYAVTFFAGNAAAAVAFNGTSSASGLTAQGFTNSSAIGSNLIGGDIQSPAMGFNFVQALEGGSATPTTFEGSPNQSLWVRVPM